MDRIAESIQRATEARQRASAAESTAEEARQFGADLIAPSVRALMQDFAEFRRFDGDDDARFLGFAMDVVSFVADRWPSAQDVPETDGKGWLRLSWQTDSADIRIQAIRQAMSGAIAADGDIVGYTVADGMARKFAATCGADETRRMRYSSLFGFAVLAVWLRTSQRAAEEARREAESAIAGALAVGARLAPDGCLCLPMAIGEALPGLRALFGDDPGVCAIALCGNGAAPDARYCEAHTLPMWKAPADVGRCETASAAEYQANRTEAIKGGAARIFNDGQESERRYMLAKRCQDELGYQEEGAHDAYMAASDSYHTASLEVETAISEEMRGAYDAGFQAGASGAFDAEKRAAWKLCTDETLAILPDVAVAIGSAVASHVEALSDSLETMTRDGKVDQTIGAIATIAAYTVAGDIDAHDAIYRAILSTLS